MRHPAHGPVPDWCRDGMSRGYIRLLVNGQASRLSLPSTGSAAWPLPGPDETSRRVLFLKICMGALARNC